MASSAQEPGIRRMQPEQQQDQARHRGRIVSHAPGRMRVRLHQEDRDPAALQQIEQDLRVRQGVASVSTDARTGSVLVHYDHRALSKDDLIGMLYDVGVTALDLVGAEGIAQDLGGHPRNESTAGQGVADHSVAATGLLDALTDLDHRISQMTGGKVDLKLLVPAGLGLLALRQVALNGFGLGQVPGYVLLWYTFDSFYKLHQRQPEAKAGKVILEGNSDSSADADA